MRDNGAIEGAAAGFAEGDDVIAIKKRVDYGEPNVKVIGFVDGIKSCASDIEMGHYFIFYRSGENLMVANCKYGTGGPEIISTKPHTELAMSDATGPITFFCKRFTHNVPTNGVIVQRDLYFIATSMHIPLKPYTGWVNFVTANPEFPLVTNTFDTQIPMTSQVMADMVNVNTEVNTNYTYVSDPSGNDNWRFLEGTSGGDCEDFALEKAKRLLSLGYPASALHIEVGIAEGTVPSGGVIQAHAWLVVQTTAGDYALDIGRNNPIRNSSYKSSTGAEYYSRRRQIGDNWSVIDAFGMLTGANPEEQGIPGYDSTWYVYIFDPQTNLFHAALYGTYGQLFEGGVSYNFSNDAIYLVYPVTIDSYPYDTHYELLTYNFNSLGLLELSSTQYVSPEENLNYNYPYVTKDGTLFYLEPSDYSGEVLSPDGYFDFKGHPPLGGGWRVVDPPATIEIGDTSNPFLLRIYGFPVATYEFLTPWGETMTYIQEVPGYYYSYFPWLWFHIEAEFNFQSFLVANIRPEFLNFRDAERSVFFDARVYKNNSSCLSEILSAVGVEEGNLYGFAYLPFTDRLNRKG